MDQTTTWKETCLELKKYREYTKWNFTTCEIKKNFNETIKLQKWLNWIQRFIQDPCNIQNGNLPDVSAWLEAIN